MSSDKYVGRGGHKLEWALDNFDLDVSGLVCCDLGSNVGGFVDCLLQRGAVKVYSVDTSYGTLAWTLRNDERVVVMERSNALHIEIEEKVDLVTCDVGWTRQGKVMPKALTLLKPAGRIVSLLKPQYEAAKNEIERGKGRVKDDALERILDSVRELYTSLGVEFEGPDLSPFLGGKGKNPEYYSLITT